MRKTWKRDGTAPAENTSMTILRNSSAAILALFIGWGDVSLAHANATGAAASAARAAAGAARFKSPYKKGAQALAAGPLLSLHNQTYVAAQEYQDLSLAVQTLLKKFPADKHYFVGLGRDPAPLIAFLQNLGGKELAVNFPASSNGAINPGAQVLADYAKRLIPAETLQGGRTIVFVDVTSSGRALNHYVPLITPHLNGLPVARAAFATRSWTNIWQHPGANHVIDTAGFPDVNQYFGGKYENAVAEYPRHVPGSSPVGQLDSPLPQYKQFRDAVMLRMEQDEVLHKFLTHEAGPAFVAETPQEAAARIAEEAKAAEARAAAERLAEQARVREERAARVKDLRLARAFPGTMRLTINKLVAELPERADGHDKGPYLSESAEKMNGWLKESIKVQAQSAELVPAVRRAGPNLVVAQFMDKVEEARAEGKIRNRDYRRLMGHALSYATMDAPMLKALTARFEKSKHFRRELSEESEYYLGSHAKKAREETASMAANFQVLQQHLPAVAPTAKREAADGE